MASGAVVLCGDWPTIGLPPYLASLVISENPRPDAKDDLHRLLRPYGGLAYVGNGTGNWSVIRRDGLLPGSADYTGDANYDELVAAPLSVLWFGDTVHHHKLYWKGYLTAETGRGFPPAVRVTGGAMRYTTLEPPRGPNPATMPYAVYLKYMDTLRHVDVAVDVYTGRLLSNDEVVVQASSLPLTRPATRPASLVRPIPSPASPRPASSANPTAATSGAIDYGNMLTLRSGTAAFYDRRTRERPGQYQRHALRLPQQHHPRRRRSPAASWTGNCTCNYPLHTSLASRIATKTRSNGPPGAASPSKPRSGASASISARPATAWRATARSGSITPAPVPHRRRSPSASRPTTRARSIITRSGCAAARAGRG